MAKRVNALLRDMEEKDPEMDPSSPSNPNSGIVTMLGKEGNEPEFGKNGSEPMDDYETMSNNTNRPGQREDQASALESLSEEEDRAVQQEEQEGSVQEEEGSVHDEDAGEKLMLKTVPVASSTQPHIWYENHIGPLDSDDKDYDGTSRIKLSVFSRKHNCHFQAGIEKVSKEDPVSLKHYAIANGLTDDPHWKPFLISDEKEERLMTVAKHEKPQETDVKNQVEIVSHSTFVGVINIRFKNLCYSETHEHHLDWKTFDEMFKAYPKELEEYAKVNMLGDEPGWERFNAPKDSKRAPITRSRAQTSSVVVDEKVDTAKGKGSRSLPVRKKLLLPKQSKQVVKPVVDANELDGGKAILMVIRHDGPHHGRTAKGSMYNVHVQWDDNRITHEPLNKVIRINPELCAKYGQEHGLLSAPGWKSLKAHLPISPVPGNVKVKSEFGKGMKAAKPSIASGAKEKAVHKQGLKRLAKADPEIEETEDDSVDGLDFDTDSSEKHGAKRQKKDPPESVHQVLIQSNRRKIMGVAKHVLKVHSATEMRCQPDWPQVDGAYIVVNEIETNNSGRQKQSDTKQRKKPQVIVFCRDMGAQKRVMNALPVDLSKYDLKICFDANEFDEAIEIGKPAPSKEVVSVDFVEQKAEELLKQMLSKMSKEDLLNMAAAKESLSAVVDSKSATSSGAAEAKKQRKEERKVKKAMKKKDRGT